MLNYDKTRFGDSFPMPAAPGANIVESGLALILVASNDGIEANVKPSTGAAGETFYGISITDQSVPALLTGVFTYTVKTGEAGVAVANVGTIVGFVDGTERIQLIRAGVPFGNVTGIDVSAGGVVSLPAGDGAGANVETLVGDVIQITYTYAPTVAQRQYAAGTIFNSGAALADPGVARTGLFFTSNFDTASAWAVRDVPKLGANGTFTKAGGGADATGARVVALPTAEFPFLGLEISL